MRNLKKFFAVVLVVALMITSMATAFAAPASTGATEAADLKELGLYDGVGYQLTDSVKRFESMVMLGKILGIEEAAEAGYATVAAAKTELAAKFTDTATLPDWSVKVLAYEVKTGMVQGGDGKLNPMGVINAAGFATMIARNVLADETIEPEDALALLAEAKAFTPAQVAQFASNTNLTRGVLVQVAYSSLKAEDADGVTVIAKLAENNEELTAIAKDQGLIVPITVESVAAITVPAIAVGGTPVLPATVKATLSTTEVVDADITWDTADFTKVGEVTVNGVLADYDDYAVTAKVTVNALALAVDSVTAINLTNFTVKFNMPIDSATNTTTNIKLYKNGSTSTTTYASSLAADKMTLTIAVATAAQGDTFKVAYSGVKNLDGVAIVAGDKTVTMGDTSVPTVIDVIPTSSTTFDVIFSEPMNITAAAQVWDQLYIDGNKIYATVATNSLSLKNKITVTLASKLTVGDHTYKITGWRDWAGYPLTTREGSLTIVSDTTAPSIESASVTNLSELTVVFNEPVSLGSIAIGSANFTATQAGGSAVQIAASGVANPSGDNKTFVLTMAAPFTPAAIVNIDISYKSVADLEGNAVATATIFSLKAADDLIKPTVTGTVTTTNNTINLVYSEKVTGATTGTNYTLFKDGVQVSTTVTATAVSGDTTGTKYTIGFSGNTTLNGNYILKISNVTDATVRANAIVAATEVAATLVDIDPPALVPASATKEYKDADADGLPDSIKMVVAFDENMDSTTALNLANYIVKFAGGTDMIASTITGATAAFGGDNKTVVITLPGTEALSTTIVIGGQTITTATDAVVVKVLAVKDANQNVLIATDINANLTLGGYVAAGMTLTSVNAVAKNQIALVSAVPFLSIDPNGIRIYKTGTTDIAQPLLVSLVSFSADMKTATLTLAGSMNENATYDVDETSVVDVSTLRLGVVSATAIKNNAGQNVAAGTLTDINTFTVGTGVTYAVADKIVPTVASVKVQADSGVGNDIIEVTFNEDVAIDIVAVEYDITVTDITPTTPVVLLPTDFAVSSNESKMLITITKADVAAHKFTVSINNNRYIADDIGDTDTFATANNHPAVVAATTVKNVAGTADATISEKVSPAAPTAVAVTPVGGTVVANTLNGTNTNMTAVATITAGQATGGKAELYVGATLLATDATIIAADTSVAFDLGTTTTATLQAAVVAGGVVTVKLYDLAGNVVTSIVANPTLVVDYTVATVVTPLTVAAASITVTDASSIVFSELLSPAGKAAVEAAITAAMTAGVGGADSIAYNWNNATFTVTLDVTDGAADGVFLTIPVGDIKANITDVAGNASANVVLVNNSTN